MASPPSPKRAQERYEETLEELQREVATFNATVRRLNQAAAKIVESGPRAASIRQLVDDVHVARSLAEQIAGPTGNAVDRTWTAVRSRDARRLAATDARYRLGEKRPWNTHSALLAGLDSDLNALMESVAASVDRAVGRSAAEQFDARITRLWRAMAATQGASAERRSEAFVQSRVAEQADELAGSLETWRVAWVSQLLESRAEHDPFSLSREILEQATAEVDTHLAAASRLAETVRAELPPGTYAVDETGRPLLNQARPVPMIQRFPVGWDRPIPEMRRVELLG